MARELDSKMLERVQKALKKLSGNDPEAHVSESAVVKEANVPQGMVGRLIWAAEPLVWPSLKFSGTDAAIVKARDGGLRWERIAARTGMSVSEVKNAYERKSGKNPRESYTGRGRRFDANGATPAASGKKSGGTAANGRGQRGASGRRQAAAAKDEGKATTGAQRGRRGARTRAERAAAGKNPS